MLLNEIQFEMVLEGDYSDWTDADSQVLKSTLSATLALPAERIVLQISSGSVVVLVTVQTTDPVVAETINGTVLAWQDNKTVAQMDLAAAGPMAVDVVSIQYIGSSNYYVTAPSPPRSPPPPPAASSPPSPPPPSVWATLGNAFSRRAVECVFVLILLGLSAWLAEVPWLREGTRTNAVTALGLLWIGITGSVSLRRAVSASVFVASVLPILSGFVAHTIGDALHVFVSDAFVTITHTLLVVLCGWLMRG